MTGTSSNLHLLAAGTKARVKAYAVEDAYCAQLMRMGLVPGTEFTVMRQAPLGDPIEISLRGFSLALRPSEAQALEIEVLP